MVDYMELAKDVANNSTCLHRKVGAVLVKDGKVIGVGYNGPIIKFACMMHGCKRDKLNIPSGERLEVCRALHAEVCCILDAYKHYNNPLGATMYVTHAPCRICANVIYDAGISSVIFDNEYPDSGIHLLSDVNVSVNKYKGVAI